MSKEKERYDYFKMVEDKYKSRVSMKRPIVIRMDGKNICKNLNIDMLNEDVGGFAYALKGLAKYFSRRFKTLCLASSDEVSIIITDTTLLKNIINGNECQKISSLIAQECYPVFNRLYFGDEVVFDVRSFNIHENKLMSSVKYRIGSARNVCAIYIAKRHISYRDRKGKNIDELEQILEEKVEWFKDRSNYIKMGYGVYKGEDIDLEKFMDTENFYECEDHIIKEVLEIIEVEDNEEDMDWFD